MKIQERKWVFALTGALGIGSAFLAIGPAQAQDFSLKVDVTGSSIRRAQGEGALPVQTIGRAEIIQAGANNAMDVLNLISANNTSLSVNLSYGTGVVSFGNQTASLRGLGGQYTLVLVNGKRLGSFAGGISGAEGVNLSAIPVSAIDRVEVLTDGASAIYGSDAIAGVINYIMRQDFTGVDAMVQYGAPTRSGGGQQWILQGTLGAGDLAKDKYNAFVSIQYQGQKSLDQRDRNFSNTSYIPGQLDLTSFNAFPAMVYDPVSFAFLGTPGYPNCAPSIAIDGLCWYDPARTSGVQSIPQQSQLNLFGSAQFQINADWKAYLTGMYSRSDSKFTIQPTPLSAAVLAPSLPSGSADILIQPTSPYYPHQLAADNGLDGQPLGVLYRCFLCGNRANEDTNDAWQIVAGMKGTAWDWYWDASFNYSANTSKEQPRSGFFQFTQIVPLLNSLINTSFNPFGPSLDSAQQAVNALQFTGVVQDSKLDGYGIDLKGTGEIYDLPAGPVAVAVGFQAGKQTLNQSFNPLLTIGDISGYSASLSDIDHSRTQWAVYGEVNVPIIKGLDATGQLRYDHYSDFGSTTNPKVSLRWQAAKTALLRGSWGTGFAAPTLYQLWTPVGQGLTQSGLADPLRCPDPNAPNSGSNPDCNTQYPQTIGGNPNLQPATSTTWSVGGIVEPLQGLSIGADWIWLDLKNTVNNGVPIATILDPQLYPLYANLVTRAPTCNPSAFVPDAPCPITAINQQFVNLGRTKIEAIDVTIQYRSPMTEVGRFALGFQGSYYIKYDQQQPDGSMSGYVSNQYQAVASGIVPRWKWYAPINWNYGPWSATLANTYQSSYIDVNTDFEGNQRRAGSLSLWDLQGSYTGFKDWTLTLGAKNLFDRNPPFTNSYLNNQAGYDPTYYDARARFIYGSIRYAFK